jgi:hypothetical protein
MRNIIKKFHTKLTTFSFYFLMSKKFAFFIFLPQKSLHPENMSIIYLSHVSNLMRNLLKLESHFLSLILIIMTFREKTHFPC